MLLQRIVHMRESGDPLYERAGQVQRVEEYLDPTLGSQLGV